MPESLYSPALFSELDPGAVLARLRREGWDPIPITDPPGYVYPPHAHAETKLLAIVRGSMDVRADDAVYRCRPGDQVVIPGRVEHAALVGPEGCTFYWSEQVR